MTTREAEDFIACVPWRAVKMVEVGDTGKTPDPHEYVIRAGAKWTPTYSTRSSG